MTIEERLSQLWDLHSREDWDKYARLTVRAFKSKGNGCYSMTIIHNTLRDHWEQIKSATHQSNGIQTNSCVLDDPNNPTEIAEKYTPYGTLMFRNNSNPTLKHHLFIKTPEHREEPHIGDHATMIDFTSHAVYAAFLNLRGAGAGLPDHLHFQGQLRIHFPLLTYWDDEGIGDIVRTGEKFTLHRYAYPNYGIVLAFDARAHKKDADELLCEMHKPLQEEFNSFNLLYDKNRVAIFPRRNETAQNVPPELEAAGMKRWQIAGQEMGHLFTAKYKQIAEVMTRESLIGALQDVTLIDHDEQRRFENFITKYTKRHDR